MKKFLLFPLILMLTLSVTVCDNDSPELMDDDTEQGSNNNDNNEDTPSSKGRYLIRFTSRIGNTERIVQTIQTSLNSDILEIESEVPYNEDYNSMLQRVQREQAIIAQGNYPSVSTSFDTFGSYDIVFIGYPIWYGHMATTIQAFLHTHSDRLVKKRIALFASNGSSGINTSVNKVRSLYPEATFIEILLLTSSTSNQRSTLVVNG